MQHLSEYAEILPSDTKAWCKEKLDFIGGIDRFQSGNVGKLDDSLPDVDASDLVYYLVLQTQLNNLKPTRALKLIINL